MGDNNFLPRWATSNGDELLQEGLNYYSQKMLRMVHKHRPDLLLIIAAMKLCAPALERHLYAVEKEVLDMLIANSVTVDLTGLQQEAGNEG